MPVKLKLPDGLGPDLAAYLAGFGHVSTRPWSTIVCRRGKGECRFAFGHPAGAKRGWAVPLVVIDLARGYSTMPAVMLDLLAALAAVAAWTWVLFIIF